MMNLSAKMPIELPEGDVSPKLTIMLAEYAYQQDRQRQSLEAVGQSLKLYTTSISILVPVGAASILLSTQPAPVLAAVLCISATIAAGVTLLLFYRYFRARMSQLGAELALSRVRQYLVTKHKSLAPFITGSVNDDWPTADAFPWSSPRYSTWIADIFTASMLSGLAAATLIFSIAPNLPIIIHITIGLLTSAALSDRCYTWLVRRLDKMKTEYHPRFPSLTSSAGSGL